MIKLHNKGDMIMDMNIGFIGYGNMAQAMAKGLLKNKVVDPDCVYACARDYEKLCMNAQKLQIHPCESAFEVIENTDMIIIAVKPYQIEEVLNPLKEELKGKIVVSVVAGYTFEMIEKILVSGTSHITAIPNIPISCSAGIMVTEKLHNLNEKELEIFYQIFEPIALIEMVETNQLSIASAIGGCAPAYTAMYMEALADAGVKHGLSRKSAYRLAAQMICGTGKLYLEDETHPGIIKDAVCSPKGTTIKGVASLEKNGFRGCVIAAIDAVEEKN